METKWSSLVSYGLTVEALTDFLPLEVTLDVKTETFVGNRQADAHLTREYRRGFVVPAKV